MKQEIGQMSSSTVVEQKAGLNSLDTVKLVAQLGSVGKEAEDWKPQCFLFPLVLVPKSQCGLQEGSLMSMDLGKAQHESKRDRTSQASISCCDTAQNSGEDCR